MQSIQKYWANKVMHLIERFMATHWVATGLFVTGRCTVTWLEEALWWLVTTKENKASKHCHGLFCKMHSEDDLKAGMLSLNTSLQLPI